MSTIEHDMHDATSSSTFETLIRNREALDDALLDPRQTASWINRMLGLSAVGLGLHGLAVGASASILDIRGALATWLGPQPMLTLPLVYIFALTLSLALCLPSFWFYTQLAGLDAPFRFITAQALRTQSRVAVLLLGALPFYVAIALGHVVGLWSDAGAVVGFGLAMPFIVGLLAVRGLLTSFRRLMPKLPLTHPRRGGFLLAMILAWGAIYTAVAPIALWRLGRAAVALAGGG